MTTYNGPYSDGLWGVLTWAHEGPFSVQSNFARSMAPEVALAASLGYISVVAPDGRTYTRSWYITAAGLTALSNKEHMAP